MTAGGAGPGKGRASGGGGSLRDGRLISYVGGNLARFGGVYLLIALVIFFSLEIPDTFATSVNARVIITSQAVAAILAFAIIAPLSADILDLSVAGNMTLSVVFIGWLQAHHTNAIVSVFATLALGLTIGLVNSLIIVRFRVPGLIATLGTSSILAALAYWLTDGNGVSLGISKSFARAGTFTVFSIPAPVLYMVVVGIFFYYLMELTPTGRRYRAIGSNREAARLTGLRVNVLTMQVLLLSGVTSSVAGIVYVARLGTAPISAGDPYLLAVFAAVFLGSTQILPGRFNVIGTLVAVYLLATGVNGVQLMYPNNAWIQNMFSGVTLIVAVALSLRRRKAASVATPPADAALAAQSEAGEVNEYPPV